MMNARWNPEKSIWLKETRGFSFEDILQKNYVGSQKHQQRKNQRVMYFEINGYIWAVPFVTSETGFNFLKTLYPSRRATRLWKKGQLRCEK